MKSKNSDGLTLHERLLVFNMLTRERLKDLELLEKSRQLSPEEIVEQAAEKEKLRQYLNVKEAVFRSQYAAISAALCSQNAVENAIDNARLRQKIEMTSDEIVFWAIENDPKAKRAIEMMKANYELFQQAKLVSVIQYPSDMLVHLGKVGFKVHFIAKWYPYYFQFKQIDVTSPVYEKRLDSYIAELENLLMRTFEQGQEGIITHKDHLVLNAVRGLHAHQRFVKEFIPRLYCSPAFNFIRPKVVLVPGADIRQYENVNRDLFDAMYEHLKEGKVSALLDECISPPVSEGTAALQKIYDTARADILEKVDSLRKKVDF